MRILAVYLRRWRRTLFLALSFALINQVCLLLDPLILRYLLDSYAATPQASGWLPFVRGTAPAFVALIASVALAWVAKSFQNSTVHRLSHGIGAAMFSDGIRNSLRLPFLSFEKKRSGEVVEGLLRLRRDVENLLRNCVNQLFTALLAVVFIAFYASRTHWSLAPAFLVVAPVLAWVSVVLSRRVRQLDEELYLRNANLAGDAAETVRNIELVKSLGLGEQEISRFETASAAIFRLELRKIRVARLYTFFHGACVHTLRLGLLGLLLWLRFSGLITVGELLSFFLYSYFIFGPMQEFGTLVLSFRECEMSLKNFSELLQQNKESQNQGLAVSSLEHLAFRSVTFSYPAGKSPALRNLSFQASRGEVIAFVGPSGAGKTTLVKLVSALYPPAAGQVLFNGVPCSELDADSLRLRMGLVTQDTQLFSGSIRQNLLVVRPEASDAELLEKLAQASADSVLRRAANGLDTVIGEAGLRLSGGERQRLAIARALLREPDLIIFDEATSSLDALVESEIAGTVVAATRERGMIAIIIAHRLSTVVQADRIFVLDQGELVESGTHASLLQAEGLYSRLWRKQMASLASQ